MSRLITVQEACELYDVSEGHVTDLCRRGWLESAHKALPAFGGRECWWMDRWELRQVLRLYPLRRGECTPEPWSPSVPPAPAGQPTGLQLQVLAGERWHELTDIELRADGDLWTRWDDGERFIVHPDGETDQYRYEQIGVAYLRAQREAREEVA